MSDTVTGKVLWQDLTVKDAAQVAEFYGKVVGWKATPHDMGEYHDFNILDSAGNVVAGICHARGSNASLPAQWLLYVGIPDVKASAQACLDNGGEIIDGPRLMGDKQFCVIKDPAGAVLALFES